MKLSNAFSIFLDFLGALQIGFMPTLRAILRKPSFLLHPSLVSREFMFHTWTAFGNGMDENLKDVKSSFLTPNAHGVVLDVGAGMSFYSVISTIFHEYSTHYRLRPRRAIPRPL